MPSVWSVNIVEQDGTVVATLAGELDIAGAGDAFGQVTRRAGTSRILLDLTGVEFIDSSGINQILRLVRQSRVRLVLAPGSQPERVMTITGVLHVVPCFPTPAEAVAGWGDA